MTIQAPSPPYLGPPAHFSAGDNKPPKRWVIHCTVSPCEQGGARDIAAYFRTQAAGGSAHYVVDPGETVQAAYDDVICWHAPPNPHSMGEELCDPMRGGGKRWRDMNHTKMLRRAAADTAQGCLHFSIPLRRLSVADLKAGKEGICGHDDVSDAFKQSTHWDPGPAFPWERFMRMVRQEAKRLLAEDAKVPEPGPEEAAKERAKPSRITTARRVLRHALAKRDGIHDRKAIRKALRDLHGLR